jgi:type I restriction enzyme S subunit
MTMPEQKKAVTPRLRFPEFRDAGPWEVKRLGDESVAKFITDTAPRSDLHPETYVSTENMLPDFGGITQASSLPTSGTIKQYRRQDILIANIRPYLKKIWQADRNGTASNDVIVVRPSSEIHPSYLGILLASDTFISYVMAGAKGLKMPRGDIALIKQYPVGLPKKISEQQKIADCLSSLDERIELEAQKLEALKAHKKGLMQQLFPREGETTPRLRFPEFRDAGPWEVKRLGEVFCERSERGGNGLELLSVTISDGVVRAAELERKNNANADLSNYKKVCPGDIVYNSMRMWQGASGVSWWHGVVSPAYTVVTPKESQNAVFWAYCFKLEHSIAKFACFSQGVTSDTWNLKYPAFSAIEMAFPAEPAEQQKIADCLSSLDERIELEAKKLEALKAHKKGLMQQLFPREGETTPRLRFPEFRDAGPWEVKRVGYFLTESRIDGSTGDIAKKLTVKLWGGGVVSKNEYLPGSPNTKYYRRKVGQFIYSKLDFLNGAFGIIPYELDGYESTLDLPAFDFTKAIVPRFFLEYVRRPQFYKKHGEQADGSRKAKRIQVDYFLDLYVAVPCLAEQQKIADCLSSLDERIELEAKKLEALKAHKKGLMQQLFPKGD